MKNSVSRSTRPSDRLASNQDTPVSLFSNLFKRELDDDIVVYDDSWLKDSGLQRQLEFEGYQLRWVNTDRVNANLADGWRHVTVSHYLFWLRRVRRRHGRQNQYLLKRTKSFRSLG